MRHRSHIAFILLAAALFAAPQMAQDISTLKGAVAARIRGEIMHAFLGLHSNESAAATRATRADSSLFACDSSRPEAQPARASQGKTAARRAEPRPQTAMLTDPADKSNGLPPSAVADELASLPRQLLTETRLAMLTPPGNGVEPPPPALGHRFESGDARGAKAAPAVRDNFRELERHAIFLKVRFDIENGVRDAELIRRAAEEAAAASVEGAKAKSGVQKVRRPARACGGNKAPCPLAPVPVAALRSPHAPSQISDGE